MRHRKKGRKLNRTTSHRKAMLANMATSLIERESIETTDAKAKELRGFVERAITFAKRGNLHARRQVMRVIKDRSAVTKLFDDIAPRFVDREGGYTRIVKIGQRKGDGAPISVIQLVGGEGGAREMRRAEVEEIEGVEEE